VEFFYATDPQSKPKWRRVIPYGLVHGPLAYLIGKPPDRGDHPVYFRLDRMTEVRASEVLGYPPDDWDIDVWLTESFGVWRDEKQNVVLRVLPGSAARALEWRFHRSQVVERLEDGGLRIRFSTGGMRDLAEHLFGWGGEMIIEGPEALLETMRERISAANTMMVQGAQSGTTATVVLSADEPLPTAMIERRTERASE
jgi:proteasome accessory factor B